MKNLKTIKERYIIELKKATNDVPKSFLETYSSFTNTKGGLIVLGVEEGKGETKI